MKKNIAVILCGGKGERLRPLTNSIPKPLVQINKKPILEYIINYLLLHGFKKIILATGYKSKKIDSFVKNLPSKDSIDCIYTGDVDIIKRLEIVTKDIKDDIFLLYGDTIANVDFKLLKKYHTSNKFPFTITRYPLTTKFGIIYSDDNGKVTNFKEKPTLDIWYNIGYMYINRKIFKKFSLFKSFVELLENLVTNSQINSFNHNGYHITVNTLEELKYAETNINNLIDKNG